MNYERRIDDWQELKQRVRGKWSKVTDNDLARLAGGLDGLAEVVQRRYRLSRERARDRGLEPRLGDGRAGR